MKHLLMTTALVAATSFGAFAQTAQTGSGATTGQVQVQQGQHAQMQGQQGANVPAFLASNFTGMTLYTLDSDQVRGMFGQRQGAMQGNQGQVVVQGQQAQGQQPVQGQQPGAVQQTAQGDVVVQQPAQGDVIVQGQGTTMQNQGTAQGMGTGQGMTRWNTGDAFTAERDRWESVGSIADVVMTQDGSVQGILIDVGGFLGFFARTVMIDIDDLYFVADSETAEDLNDFFVVATMSREQLESLPEWNDDNLRMGFQPRFYSQGGMQGGMQQGGQGQVVISQGQQTQTGQQQAQIQPQTGQQTQTGTQQQALTGQTGQQPQTGQQGQSVAAATGQVGTPGAPAPAPQGYQVVDRGTLSADQLIGANVYDAMGEEIGNVNDLTLSNQAEVREVLVDVGGFLGIGSHTVALPVENVDILWNADNNNLRIHLPMTRDMIETLPEHQG
jgi:sporulation protein YlmC with PRC-barrel domain